MTTAYVSHPDCALHDMGASHPESPARLAAITRALTDSGLQTRLTPVQAPEATLEAIKRVHKPGYVDALLARSPQQGLRQLDPDTAINPHSVTAARHAAGALIAAVDAALGGDADNAFCAVRPPGHHATPERAMGFCLFNNIAVGAAHALQAHALDRVAIVDFDVHHGNGTEAVFRDDPRVLFCSSYQYPLWPFPDNTGIPGRIIKSPLDPGSGGREFRAVVERDWLPALTQFAPELIFISAGFDAHRADPLAGLNFEADDYRWVTEQLCAAAQELCQGRVVSTLEGGYALDALAASAVAHIEVLAGQGRQTGG